MELQQRHHTLQVPLGAVNTAQTATITQTGGTPVQLAEPTAPLITFTSPAHGDGRPAGHGHRQRVRRRPRGAAT